MKTWQLATVLWLITGVTVAGIGVLAVLAVPELAVNSTKLIPIVSAAGFVLAFIVSWIIAKQLNSKQLAGKRA
ncbi:MAG: hypothetical protein ABL901_04065 [Hyphomicrobiaceae bacterium]